LCTQVNNNGSLLLLLLLACDNSDMRGWHTLELGQSVVTFVIGSTPQGPFGTLITCAASTAPGIETAIKSK